MVEPSFVPMIVTILLCCCEGNGSAKKRVFLTELSLQISTMKDTTEGVQRQQASSHPTPSHLQQRNMQYRLARLRSWRRACTKDVMVPGQCVATWRYDTAHAYK